MRMSDAEAIMWAVEKDPALRSDFTNITVLDGRPDEAHLRAKLDAALADIPRLSQRVVSPPLRLAPPEWRDDPTLDLDYHVRKVAAPAPGGTRELLDLAAACAATPLDRSRPLWEFTLVEGLEGDRTALLQKVHHALTDGVGGLKLSLSLVDFDSDAPPPAAPRRSEAADSTTPVEVVTDAVTFTARRQLGLARSGLEAAARVLSHPDRARRGISETAGLAASIRRQVLVTEPARSELLRPRSLGRRFEVFQVPLAAAKERAASLGGSVNDLFVTAVTGALGAYHDRMGTPCEELRMAMAVSLRTDGGDVEGNSFAPSRVLVPVRPKDPAARFERVRERLAEVKREPALGAAGSLAGVLAPLPTTVLVSLTRSQARTIDFASSNLRGSPVDLYAGGARIAASFPMGPRTGCALNVTVLSYKGSLDLGLNLDPAAVTDPAALLECLEESFASLLEGA